MLEHLQGLQTCVIRSISSVRIVRRPSSEVITLSLVANVTSSRGGGQEEAGSRVRAAQI